MSSAKRSRNISSNAASQKPERQNLDPQWGLENQQLESEAQANSRLRQQITKQSYADSSVQAEIKDKISELKQNAVKLAQKLQSQKRKNIQLSAIIKHMSFIRQQEKKVETQHRDDLNFQNVDNLLRKIKKLQYDLQQIFSKLNELTSKNKEKKNEVDTFRTQRVIDSGIFLKIQKQIIQYETQYKKLLIEKTKYQKQYIKNLQNYKKMKADIQKEQYVTLSKRQSTEKNENQDNFFMNVPQIEHAVKFTQINHQEGKKRSFSSSKKTLTIVDAKRQQHHQQVEYAVKKLFMDTGLNSVESLVDLFRNIEEINQELFKQVNRDTDKIAQLNKQIVDLKSKKVAKTIKYYEKQPSMTKSEIKMKEAKILQNQIQKIQSSVNKQTSLLNQFIKTNELRVVSATAQIEFPEQFGIENLEDFFANLENNLNQIISNYSQFKKDLIETEKNLHRESQPKQQTVEELISKIKKMEQSQKIMVREDFQKQYEKILKSQNGGKRKNGKKKTTIIKKY